MREFWHDACATLGWRVRKWVRGSGCDAVRGRKRLCFMKCLSRVFTLALIVLAGAVEMIGGEPAVVVPAEPGKSAEAKPQRPEQGVQRAGDRLPVDVQTMLTEFREQQKAKLEEYRKLAKQTRDTSAAKREVLREQLRQLLSDQRAERERLRDQIRDRLQELTAELPERREVLEAAKEAAKDQKERARGD